MQGQKSFIGPLPDTMNFDNNTMSTDASIDQHIFWNNMQNSTNQVQNLSGWNVGESSCSGTQNYAILNEQNANDGPASSLSLNNGDVNHNNSQIPYSPLFIQSASNAVPQDRTMASEIIEYGLNCQAMDSSNMHKTAHASSSSAPFVLPSRGGGYFVEENEGRACKRKALEGTAGQSSMSGSSSYFPPGGGNDWHNVPDWYNANGVSTSTSFENPSGVGPQDQANARLGLNGGGNTLVTPLSLNVATDLGSSRRNHRVRLNPSAQQESLPNVLSNGSTIGHNAPSYPQSSRLLPLNNFSDTRSLQSARWTRGSSSRAGYSLNFGERNAGPTEDTESTTLLRNVSENPVFVSTNEMRSSAEISTDWGLTGGNTSRNLNIPGNVSRNVHPSSGPNGVPHRNAPRYSRRLSEYVRRSLLSSTVPEPGVQNSGNSRLHSGPSSQQMALSAGASDQGDRLSRLRSALLLERQLDGAFGSPHSLRTLTAGNEGRTRLVSEIRSVLDLMRRGGGLQLEDVVILDQSVFFGMADIHDRHRDMRLDVDNMSYEELLALEERIGNVSTGLSEETIFNHLKQRKYFSIAMGAQSDVEPCCICREEYNDGEDIGTVECGHEFHSGCIKQWLMQKNLCPICKTAALNK